MPEKLVCDKCGFELTDKEGISLALEGTQSWQNAQRSRGCEPRGVFPCKYYIQCKGEMQLVRDVKDPKKKRLLFGRQKGD